MELKLLDSSQISRLPPSCIRVVKSPSPVFSICRERRLSGEVISCSGTRQIKVMPEVWLVVLVMM